MWRLLHISHPLEQRMTATLPDQIIISCKIITTDNKWKYIRIVLRLTLDDPPLAITRTCQNSDLLSKVQYPKAAHCDSFCNCLTQIPHDHKYPRSNLIRTDGRRVIQLLRFQSQWVGYHHWNV